MMFHATFCHHFAQEAGSHRRKVHGGSRKKPQRTKAAHTDTTKVWEILEAETHLSLRETKWMDTVEKTCGTNTMEINRCWKLCGVTTVLVKTGWRNWYITLSKLE